VVNGILSSGIFRIMELRRGMYRRDLTMRSLGRFTVRMLLLFGFGCFGVGGDIRKSNAAVSSDNDSPALLSLSLFLLSFFLLASQVVAGDRVGDYDSWSVFTTKLDSKQVNHSGDKSGGTPEQRHLVCYMLSTPKMSKGTYKSRGDPYIMVTYIKRYDSEVMFSSGYSYLKGSSVKARIKNGQGKVIQSFEMFIDGKNAWAPDNESDIKLINAMKRGVKMSVLGKSIKNTQSIDEYSLMGFTAAYKKMISVCDSDGK